jgi:glutamine cyclotransferase
LIKFLPYYVFLFFLTGHANPVNSESNDLINYSYRVTQQYPHSDKIFTQGLVFSDGLLYESGGQYGRSSLIKRTLDNTQPLLKKNINPSFFAEGITLLNDQIYLLTWRSNLVFVYDKETFALVNQFKLDGEGWGLTNNGRQLIVSNGSNQLQFIDPETFTPTASISVMYQGKPQHQLNELEWVNGLIYANVWQTSWIAIINPNNGQLVGKINLHGLVNQATQSPGADVLNGIAYDQQNDRLFITGKFWPTLYQLELIE